MRVLWPLLLTALGTACGPDDERPPAADPCDPATMDCHNGPPNSGGLPDGNQGGSDSGNDASGNATGEVLLYVDDFFDRGVGFPSTAEVSATAKGGGRVRDAYDGARFELAGVLKDASNWFMVVPADNSGMLPTLTPIDTRTKLTGLGVGLASERLVDGIYQQSLAASERNDTRAQIVMRVTDTQGRALAGVIGSYTSEVIIYRSGAAWLLDASETDDSGMIFFGNVPASSALSPVNVNLLGTVSARVEAWVAAGATTVVTAIVSAP